MTEAHWDERYEKTNVPWDTGEFVQQRSLRSGRVLEVGCGTGTNAIWLVSRGMDVLGIDIPARTRFAGRVAELLSPTDLWLSIIGSTEGPPRRSALDLVAAVEPVFELLDLRSTEFHANIPTPAAAWLLQARHRATPAQPSTYVGL